MIIASALTKLQVRNKQNTLQVKYMKNKVKNNLWPNQGLNSTCNIVNVAFHPNQLRMLLFNLFGAIYFILAKKYIHIYANHYLKGPEIW